MRSANGISLTGPHDKCASIQQMKCSHDLKRICEDNIFARTTGPYIHHSKA